MYKLIVGNISSERQVDWFRKDENPYAVWEGKSIVEEICIGSTWVTADEMLRDHVDVDWGSIAWRANKAELLRFFEVCNAPCSSRPGPLRLSLQTCRHSSLHLRDTDNTRHSPPDRPSPAFLSVHHKRCPLCKGDSPTPVRRSI